MEVVLKWIDAVAKTVIAASAAFFGWQFNSNKQMNEDINFAMDLAFHTDPRKSAAGLTIAQHYAELDRIPEIVYGAIVSKNLNSGDDFTRKAALRSASEAASVNSSLRNVINTTLKSRPPSVFMHIVDRSDLPKAQAILDRINQEYPDVRVQGIEFVDVNLSRSDVRCFSQTECSEFGEELIQFLVESDVDARLNDLTSSYGNKVTPNQFEIWLGKD